MTLRNFRTFQEQIKEMAIYLETLIKHENA